MPTLFEEDERYIIEEREEPKTHETLSLYLEEYKAQSTTFKKRLALQQFFQIKEERGSYSNDRRKRNNRFYFPTFDGPYSSMVKAWRRELEAFLGYILWLKKRLFRLQHFIYMVKPMIGGLVTWSMQR